MGYPNPNRTRKDPNRIQTEIYKYPNETEIFESVNPNRTRIDTQTSTPGRNTLTLPTNHY